MILESVQLSYDHGGSGRPLTYPDRRLDDPFLLAVVGPNGVGKTTLAKLLSGFLVPSGGDLRILGQRPHRREARGIVTLVPDTPILYYDLSAAEQLRYVASIDGTPEREVDDLLQRFEFGRYADCPPGVLSKGWRQRLALALGLLRPSPVLVVDEPFAGLDHSARSSFVELLDTRRRVAGRSAVVITHQRDELDPVMTACVELGGAAE